MGRNRQIKTNEERSTGVKLTGTRDEWLLLKLNFITTHRRITRVGITRDKRQA